MSARPLRSFVPVLLVSAALGLLIVGAAPPNAGVGYDLFQYWAAARALLSGINPYDLTAVETALSSEGFRGVKLIPAWGVPHFFALTAPLGAMPFGSALAVMLIFILAVLGICVAELGAVTMTRSTKDRWLALAVIGSSQPILMLIRLAQPAALVLAGLVLFLIFSAREGRGARVAAGAGLALTTLKPHLFTALYLLIAVSALKEDRARQQLLSAVTFTLLLAAVPLVLEPSIYALYVDATRTNVPPGAWKTPSLGTLLQHAAGTTSFAMKALPTAIGVTALALYLLSRPDRPQLSGNEGTMRASVLGICIAPYCWTYDYSLLLPAILLILGREPWHRGSLPAAALTLLGAHAALFLASKEMEWDFWYPWLVLALLIRSSPEVKASSEA